MKTGWFGRAKENGHNVHVINYEGKPYVECKKCRNMLKGIK